MRGSGSFIPSLINIMVIIFIFRAVMKAAQKKKKQANQEKEQPLSDKPLNKPNTIIRPQVQVKDLKYERPAPPAQPLNLKRCPNCGGEIPVTMLKCEICGHRQSGCSAAIVVLVILVSAFGIFLAVALESNGTSLSELLNAFWSWFTRM